MCTHLSNHRYFDSSTGGLILFAIFSLVMDVFKIGYYSSFYSCLSAIKIIYPIVQAIFVVVQVRWLCSVLGKGRETEPAGEGALISWTQFNSATGLTCPHPAPQISSPCNHNFQL